MVGLTGHWQASPVQCRKDATMRALFISTLVLALGACIPMRVSTRCQKIASDCLDACPEDRMPLQSDRTMGTDFTSDSRNACQKRCHDVAHSCETDDRK